MYRPVLEMVPTVAFPPLIALTSQVTARFRLSVTLEVNCCCPPAATIAEPGETVTTGFGLLIVKVSALDVPPPGAGVVTLTIAVPAEAMSAAVIAACKLVLEPKVVARALPFHCTVEDDMKLAPVTVRLNAAPPARVKPGFRDAAVGVGFGLGGGGGGGLDPPLHPARYVKAAAHRIFLARKHRENRLRSAWAVLPPASSNLICSCVPNSLARKAPGRLIRSRCSPERDARIVWARALSCKRHDASTSQRTGLSSFVVGHPATTRDEARVWLGFLWRR